MGTTWSVKVVAAASPDWDAPRLRALVEERLDDVDRKMSHYRADSELSRFNEAPASEPFPVSAETFAVFAEARTVSEMTGGALDITVGPLVDAWGFGPRDADAAPTDAEVERLRQSVGWDLITLDEAALTLTKVVPALRADLSAIAKGYAVDRVAEALLAAGESRLLVEVGGEVRAVGTNAEGESWRIGIERPALDATRVVQRLVPLRDAAMATSGGYRNFREIDGLRLTHVLDPRTGRPVTHARAAVSVIEASCARADGLATALLALGPDEGLLLAERLGLTALFVVEAERGEPVEHPTRRFRERFGSRDPGPET